MVGVGFSVVLPQPENARSAAHKAVGAAHRKRINPFLL